MSRGLASLLVLSWLAACSPSAVETQLRAGSETGDSETGDSETGEAEPDSDFTAECSDAANHSLPTHLSGSLRPLLDGVSFDAPPIGLDCGLGEGGPVGFVRIEVPLRADVHLTARGAEVVPRVAIVQAGCASEALAVERLLGCADVLPIVIEDIRAGTELLLAVGAFADDPALASESVPGVLDPLAIALELSLRAVLDENAVCSPVLGRCESGTVCLTELEGEPPDAVEVARCRRPPGASCANPIDSELPAPGELLQLSIDTTDPLGDAHAHACTGWRRPEQVHRLTLPAGISPTAHLEIVADDPRVGLAVRAPGCPTDRAQGCVPADVEAGPHVLVIDDGRPAEWAVQGVAPLLFIELPSNAEPATIGVSLAIVEP